MITLSSITIYIMLFEATSAASPSAVAVRRWALPDIHLAAGFPRPAAGV